MNHGAIPFMFGLPLRGNHDLFLQADELGRQYELAQRRLAGGKARGAAKQAKAAARWQPWLEEAAKLVAG